MTDVPVTDVLPLVTVTATGGQTVFTFPFLIQDSTQLEVIETQDPSGTPVVATLTEGTDYTVSINAAPAVGGTITLTAGQYPSGATAGDLYTLQRDVPVERLTDFPFRGALSSATLNTQLDTIFLIMQELERDLIRALTLPANDPLSSITLPSQNDRKGKFLGFDGTNGDAIAATLQTTALTVSAYIETLLDDVDARDARDTLKAALRETTNKLAGFTLVAADAGEIFKCDATSGAITIAGLTAASAGNGYLFAMLKSDTSVNTVTFDPAGAETVNGQPTLVLSEQYEFAIVWTDGTEWFSAKSGPIKVADLADGTDGELITWDASGNAATVAVGTAGQFLRSNGAGAAPTFQDGGLTLETPQASTSGTTVDFTGIASGAKRITMTFDGVSLSGTDNLLVQIGDSGGLETTGYSSSVSQGTTAGNATNAFAITLTSTGADAWSGQIIMTLLDSATNTWSYCSQMGNGAATPVRIGSGGKSLSAELDRVTLLTSGANTFDAGKVNMAVEF